VPPFARADIKSPYRAPVSKVNTTLGAAVEQGDTLLELSLPTAGAYHEQTKLALQQTDADYGVAKKQFQADVDVAREHLNTARAAEKIALPEERALATSVRGEAEQALLQAKLDMERALLPFRSQREVMRSGKWEEVPVEVGITDEQFTAIKSGVRVGDTVLVTP